jgi:nitronate monooxygenase
MQLSRFRFGQKRLMGEYPLQQEERHVVKKRPHRGTESQVADSAGANGLARLAGLFALLPQMVDAVKLPVVAAGGVADSRQVAAAFMLGANDVQMGTTFLCCEEANVQMLTALREASDACTIATDMITGRSARFIRNKLTDDLIVSGLEAVSFPAQMSLTAPLGTTGEREMIALFAGQPATLATDINAASFVQSLGQETTRRLRAFHD